MAETHKPPEQFTLRLRRYDPESGEAPYWDEHTVELEPHRSVLEGMLQARDKFDGSIGIRCSCRQAICGSCGVRVNGEPALACHTHLDAARQREGRRDRDRADGQHAGDQGPDRRHGRGPLEEDPARHPVAARQAAGPRARVPRAERARWSTSRRRWPASSAARASRTAWRWRSTRASSARRRSPRPTASSATRATTSSTSACYDLAAGPAGDLRLHPLLQVRRGLPEGRQPDGPDHAPAAHRRPPTSTSSTATTASATRRPSRG